MIESYEEYVSWIQAQELEEDRLEQCRVTEEAAAILMGNRPIHEVRPDHDTEIDIQIDWDD